MSRGIRWMVTSTLLTLAGCISEPSSPGLLTIEPAASSLALGDSTQLTARVFDEGDRTLNVAVTWSSKSARVATVSPTGMLVARSVGSATVTAEYGNEYAEASVSVSVQLTEVFAGVGHTCALDGHGQLTCWGGNRWGQLGDGTLFPSAVPTRALYDGPIVAMTLGSSMGCVLDPAGAAACWGVNLAGQLGLATPDADTHPMLQAVAGGHQFQRLDAGARHVCGITLDSRAWCWGGDFFGQLGIGGAQSICEQTEERCSPAPREVAGAMSWTTVSAGAEHSCAVDLEGTAYCWGFNQGGQLGDSTLADRSTPAPVYGDLKFWEISAGAEHSCALTVDSLAYCWGENSGRLGNGEQDPSPIPVAVVGNHRFQSLATGGFHTCGLTTERDVLCWGFNSVGQVGTASVELVTVPFPLPIGSPVQSLSVGYQYNCAVTVNSIAVCWGANGSGQLGRGFASGGLPNPEPVAGQD